MLLSVSEAAGAGGARAPIELTPDGRLLFAARALRSFGFGWLSVILALYLAERGFSATLIGAVFTATMVEDALLTMALSTLASRVGAARLMAMTAPLIALGGFLMALAETPLLLVAGAVLGTLSPNGQDAGPFSPLEHSLLPGAFRSGPALRAFVWYNLVAFASAALGAASAGLVLGGAQRGGLSALEAQRSMLLAYGAMGVVLTLLYLRLAARQGSERAPAPKAPTGALGLGRSRGIVLQLAALQGLDALAGGFIMQSLLAYWLHLRFGARPGDRRGLPRPNILSAVSVLAASRVAERIGLLNTMVFTHLPSNVLLMSVPFMPTFASASLLLLARHLLSQMDVPTRQAYAWPSSPRRARGGRGLHHQRARPVAGRLPGDRRRRRWRRPRAAAVPPRRRPQDRLRPAAVLPLPRCAAAAAATRGVVQFEVRTAVRILGGSAASRQARIDSPPDSTMRGKPHERAELESATVSAAPRAPLRRDRRTRSSVPFAACSSQLTRASPSASNTTSTRPRGRPSSTPSARRTSRPHPRRTRR